MREFSSEKEKKTRRYCFIIALFIMGCYILLMLICYTVNECTPGIDYNVKETAIMSYIGSTAGC